MWRFNILAFRVIAVIEIVMFVLCLEYFMGMLGKSFWYFFKRGKEKRLNIVVFYVYILELGRIGLEFYLVVVFVVIVRYWGFLSFFL